MSPIYVDAGGTVSGLGFLGGGSARRAPGERRHVAIRVLLQDHGGKPLAKGIERLAIVALPAITRSRATCAARSAFSARATRRSSTPARAR